MGNTIGKAKFEAPFDGGQVRQGTTGSNSSELDYDASLVKKLILSRRLAPFYEGKDDPTQDSTFNTNEGRSTDATQANFTWQAGTAGSKKKPSFFGRRKKEIHESPPVQAMLREYEQDCPICLQVSRLSVYSPNL